MLGALSLYFHTFFPSIPEVEEFFGGKRTPTMQTASAVSITANPPKVDHSEDKCQSKPQKELKRTESDAVQLRTENDLIRREVQATEEAVKQQIEQQSDVIEEQGPEIER
jgi:hypothetical protein